MKPTEIIKANYTLPFKLYPYQEGVVNELALLPRSGHYLAVGVGKTVTSTACALYKLAEGHVKRVLVIVPPILIEQWVEWLGLIPEISVEAYRGTPSKRAGVDIETPLFIVTSYGILKNDAEVFLNYKMKLVIIVDEATAIKSTKSQNYHIIRDLSLKHDLMLLTGTPLSKPGDAYAYIKLVSPCIYKNLGRFEAQHVEERDFFKNPTKYRNLDIIKSNLLVNSRQILKEDVLKELPDVTYQRLVYELEPKHIKLYDKLVEEMVLEIGEEKIDATLETKLWHCCQQIILGWQNFTDQVDVRPAILDLVDNLLEDLGGKKLIIFTNYRASSKLLNEYIKGSVAAYGDITAKQRDLNIKSFLTDRDCQVMIAQMQSAGYGWNPQHVCSDVLFAEIPLIPAQFEQCVGRIYRNGQRSGCQVRMAIAKNTIQAGLVRKLFEKDKVLSGVFRTHKLIKELLSGR